MSERACRASSGIPTSPQSRNGYSSHLMVTDPPYGVEYDPAWRNQALAGSNTARTGKVLNDHRADWREAWALFPGDVAYVWHGALHATTVAESLTACGFDIRGRGATHRSYVIDPPPDLTTEEWVARHAPREAGSGKP